MSVIIPTDRQNIQPGLFPGTYRIPWAKPALGEAEKKCLLDAVESTWISDGPYVHRFEEEFLRKISGGFGVTVSSGTAALHLALLAAGIKPGDEVIVPAFTFAAPVNMIIQCGAKPVYADIDPGSWCIGPDQIRENLTSKTKAVIAVHLYGNVCPVDDIAEIAKEHQLILIEDTAQAVFSKYQKQFAGTFGDFGCFSFQATKTITTGEGGFVHCRLPEMFRKLQVIRNHGMSNNKRYWHTEIGHNFRLTNLQSALGFAQLQKAGDIIRERQKLSQIYQGQLGNEEGITLQEISPDTDPVMWTLAVRLNRNNFQGNRDFVIEALAKAGIETRPGFYPFSSMPVYQAPVNQVAEKIAQEILLLPFYPGLETAAVGYICDQLKKLRKAYAQ